MTNDTRTILVRLSRECTTHETTSFEVEVNLSDLGLSAEDWNEEQARHYAENLVMAGDYPDDDWREGEIMDVSATAVTDVTLQDDE